ncbi:MAG TPA: c-type cytochrome [Burkholderiales bacterium]|nr:c-type cytochrome [Burkholderiales bacterium]
MGRIANKIIPAVILAGVMLVAGNLVQSVARADETAPEANPLSGDQKAIQNGKSWFRGVCANCHGGRADGQGERGTGADLRKFNKGFKRFVETVKNGREVPGRIQSMPAWGAVLKEEQIYQIGAYLETLAIDGADWKQGVHN